MLLLTMLLTVYGQTKYYYVGSQIIVDAKIYAYKMSVTGGRAENSDSDSLAAAGSNTNPTGIWSDETTMWVADLDDDKIYAYKMSD